MNNEALSKWIAEGDNYMFAQKPREALSAYQRAWQSSHDGHDDQTCVWLLLSIAQAAIMDGDYEEAFDALAGLRDGFAETGLVAGNPLFHLFVGLAYHGLGESEDDETDNFARALICGGPAIFSGEDPVHLSRITALLRPPAELGTWEGYEGASRDLLNDAKGYLCHLLTERLGSPPPYRYHD